MLLAALLATSAVATGITLAVPANAQVAGQTRFDIPAGPLGRALAAFGSQSGTQLSYESAIAGGLVTSGLQGAASREEALATLLRGTGLSFEFTDARTAVIRRLPAGSAAGAIPEGSTFLGTISLSGGIGWNGRADTIFTTPGSVAHVSGEEIETWRGMSPADIFKGTPGVMSGEGRSGGALDMNIRGVQGQGRAPVIVDGMQNLTSVYRGYQGSSNRSYIEPDLISGVSIEKGPSSGPGGAGSIGGAVRIATIGPDDIIEEGKKVGGRLRMTWIGNNGENAAYNRGLQDPNTNAQRAGTGRPGLLDLGGRSASLALAARGDWFDLTIAGARRDVGNYHAGTRGKDQPQLAGTPDFCATEPAYCAPVIAWYGPNSIRWLAGERILNTAESSRSWLVKGNLHLPGDHHIGFTRTGYSSDYGETYPSETMERGYWPMQNKLASVDLRRQGLSYSWTPGNPLFNLRANLWQSDLKDWAPMGYGEVLPAFDPNVTRTRGFDLTNTSLFDVAGRAVTLEYGVSWLSEDTVSSLSAGRPGRDGKREQREMFLRGTLALSDSVTLDGSLRRIEYQLHDRSPWYGHRFREDGANSWSLGAAWDVNDSLQIYGRYNDATRLPSLMEGTRSFLLAPIANLQPENAKSVDIGMNWRTAGLLAADDSLALKVNFFRSRIDDYISRRFSGSMVIYNIDKARFEGFEISARYEVAGYRLGLAANRYTKIEFCRTSGNCLNSSLAADYANNQIPPAWSLSLDLSKSFFDDRLTLGTRISRIGKRAAGSNNSQGGAATYVNAVPWSPYTLVDVSASWKMNDRVSLDLGIQNLTDRYHVEPLSLGYVPAPGRTASIGLTARF